MRLTASAQSDHGDWPRPTSSAWPTAAELVGVHKDTLYRLDEVRPVPAGATDRPPVEVLRYHDCERFLHGEARSES